MRRISIRLLIALLTFSLGITFASLWYVRHRPPSPQRKIVINRSMEEDNVAEAVFRYQLQSHKGAGVYFLSRDGNDPSDEFMQRFVGQLPLLKKESQSTRTRPSGILDKDTGEHTGILSVSQIKWINDCEVEVGGSFYNGEIEGYVYRVLHEGNQWVVMSSKLVFAS